MAKTERFPVTWRPQALAVLRIVTAFLILQHASSKFFGMPHVAYFDNLQVFSLIGLAGAIELVGGVLLLLGLFTRPVAFLLWGSHAQSAAAGLPRDCDLVIASAHPSPLSARRGFFGSRPFSRVNDWLGNHRPPAIDWTGAATPALARHGQPA